MAPAAELEALRMALRASEQKLVALSDSYPIGVYHCDDTGARTYTNDRWQQIVGLFGESSLGHAWLHALHPDDRVEVTAAWRETVASGRGFDLEFRIVRPDAAVRIVRSRARPVVADVPASGFVGALEDVTEQRENESRLRASEAFLDRTGRVAGVGGWEVDLASGAVTWSETTRSIHEVGADYRPTLEAGIAFYRHDVRPVVSAAIADARRLGKSWDLELPFVSAKGRDLWIRTFGEVEYRDGQAIRLIGAFQDITEHRARQTQLEQEQALRLQSEEHARELDRLLSERSEMLDVMAHEVRQPLNNASAALQSAAAALTAVGGGFASQRVTRAQTVLAQVLASIDNTLAVASLLARPDPIDRADTDIDTMIAVATTDLAADLRPRIRIERLTQTRTASMDMSLMRLALRNLLSNALKYSPPASEVVVRISDSDEPLALVIDVADAGGSIPADVLPRLFSRGARGKHAGVPAGHGLGLYIVHRVVELHQGRVEVIRNESDGVTFRLWMDQSPG
jgi:PAS domain S-box-containing protein